MRRQPDAVGSAYPASSLEGSARRSRRRDAPRRARRSVRCRIRCRVLPLSRCGSSTELCLQRRQDAQAGRHAFAVGHENRPERTADVSRCPGADLLVPFSGGQGSRETPPLRCIMVDLVQEQWRLIDARHLAPCRGGKGTRTASPGARYRELRRCGRVAAKGVHAHGMRRDLAADSTAIASMECWGGTAYGNRTRLSSVKG